MDNLEKYTVPYLKVICKNEGIRYYSNKRKKDLIIYIKKELLKKSIINNKDIINHIKSYLFYSNRLDFLNYWKQHVQYKINVLYINSILTYSLLRRNNIEFLYSITLLLIKRVCLLFKKYKTLLNKYDCYLKLCILYRQFYIPYFKQKIRYNILFYTYPIQDYDTLLTTLLYNNSLFTTEFNKITRRKIANSVYELRYIKNVFNGIFYNAVTTVNNTPLTV